MTVELDLIHTILVSMVVLFAGRALVAHVGVLQRFSIPAPVVGGGLVAILLAFADGLAGLKFAFNLALKDTLLLMFFTTVGLAADARMLAKGGMKLVIFLGISAVLIVAQNAIGIGAALAMDLHPVIGPPRTAPSTSPAVAAAIASSITPCRFMVSPRRPA